MATKKYVILKSRSLTMPTMDNLGVRGAPSAVPTHESMDLNEVELTARERNDLRRDPRVRAIAPPMPIKLIEPVSISADNVSMSSDVSWGIAAVRATESNYDGSGIVVAVLDTGIDPEHSAFAGTELLQRNFTEEGENDQHGHGTHCAGTIFGKNVNGRRIGIARNIKKALIGKVLGLGGGTSGTIANAVQWAVSQGAHVISMSLGIDFPGYVKRLIEEYGLRTEPATSKALEGYRANVNLFSELAAFVKAQGAFAQGTVIVAAAGNEASKPEYDIAVAPPAAGTGIISVGALYQTDQGYDVARFSNNQVDISAPGVDIISAARGGGLASMSGTSMATPHVAGVAALWAQRQLQVFGRVENESLTAQLIASGATSSLVYNFEEEDFGTGIVQAPLN